jgi:phosphatidylethanolamine/phosphatidyl-N-methylethanolamine N-methyltransferase
MSRTTAAERAEVDSRRVERVYAALARVYDGWFDWALGPGRRIAVRSLAVRAGQRVLEVGVGTGLSLPFYPPQCHLSGIDISEPMLEQARERADQLVGRRIDLRLMDARELAYADETFDHVLAPYVISVVPEPTRVMAEIARVCKPGGSVIVVNHFASSSAPVRLAERALTPASKWIGFRLDVPREIVTTTPRLAVQAERRVNLCGLWRLIEMRRLA